MSIGDFYLNARPIDQDEDPTERAFRHVLESANAFEHAVDEATSKSRVIQIRERVGAAVHILAAAERLALKRVEMFK